MKLLVLLIYPDVEKKSMEFSELKKYLYKMGFQIHIICGCFDKQFVSVKSFC